MTFETINKIDFWDNFLITVLQSKSLNLREQCKKQLKNKRSIGHIAHLRKQFKSINTYDYIITLINRRKKTLLTLLEFTFSPFEETWIPFTRMHCADRDWLKLAQWFWRRRFFNFVNVISRFRNYLPFEKGGASSSFEQIYIPFTQGCFVPSLVEIGPVVLEKKIFKFRQCIFTIS